ncbi:unnamed protein product [Paramecium sonneborni]|uniref:Amino acid transporter transmembrane domain-containing protein n=1 Tax=Paramecium sonneborni TaxID=65129 RepID=A0A8S1PEI9_9CILI|nr:unnamed protein product [Paramecium sonneborni]
MSELNLRIFSMLFLISIQDYFLLLHYYLYGVWVVEWKINKQFYFVLITILYLMWFKFVMLLVQYVHILFKFYQHFNKQKELKSQKIILILNSNTQVRSFINIILGLIGYSIPKFAYIVNILGAIGGASLNFLFPILIHKKYFENDETKRKSKFTYYSILSFGICGGLCSFIYTIVKLTSH